MGFFGPKTFLEWREPKLIRRTKEHLAERARRPWQRPLAVLVVALVMGVIYIGIALLGGKFNPKPWGYVVIPLGLLGFGVFLVYVVPFVLKFAPAEISIHEKGISRVVANTGSNWDFKDILGFRFAPATVKGQELSVLSLRFESGEVLLGVAPDTDTDQIRKLLVEHDIIEDASNGGAVRQAGPHNPGMERPSDD